MNPTTYNKFHTAMALGENGTGTASGEPTSSLRGRNVTHLTQYLLIAGTVLATITAVAFAILAQYPLAVICGIVSLVNFVSACYLKKFSSPETVNKLVNALADKVTTLFNDRERLSQAALSDKQIINDLAAELKRLRGQEEAQKSALEHLAKEKSEFEKAANESSIALKKEKEKSETLEAMLKTHIEQIERAPVAPAATFAKPAPVTRSTSVAPADNFAIPAPITRSRSASIPNISESPTKKNAGPVDVSELQKRNTMLQKTLRKANLLLALQSTPIPGTARRNSIPNANVMAAIPLTISTPLTPRRAAAAAAVAAMTATATPVAPAVAPEGAAAAKK